MNLAGVVEDDLPAIGALAPDQGEDAVVFLGFALGGAVEMKLAGDDGRTRICRSQQGSRRMSRSLKVSVPICSGVV